MKDALEKVMPVKATMLLGEAFDPETPMLTEAALAAAAVALEAALVALEAAAVAEDAALVADVDAAEAEAAAAVAELAALVAEVDAPEALVAAAAAEATANAVSVAIEVTVGPRSNPFPAALTTRVAFSLAAKAIVSGSRLENVAPIPSGSMAARLTLSSSR